eukprot:CAMPEP_0172395488 /NCGR_PEP_ID=MMETSP1061-20121228/20125_1 /TAXON_ID=37318 /ORGANISM="Pseudo-nitzschia pungens, Strain cf. pungens" /LENGTH=35 /DNA_ID= /DNA_START= /DNA_END= /DNA_ORIENTATION=
MTTSAVDHRNKFRGKEGQEELRIVSVEIQKHLSKQ